MSLNLIELSQVNKFLGNRCILRSTDLIVPQSKIFQITGANGSGKSTLLRIIAGLLEVEAGRIWRSSNLKIAYQGHQLGLYEDLTVKENIDLFQRLSGASPLYSEIVGRWHLSELLERRVLSLSRGQAWRVALAISLSQGANLVVLDEPTANLDRDFLKLLIEKIVEYRECYPLSSFVIATHEHLHLPDSDSVTLKLESAELQLVSGLGLSEGSHA